jgi:hypothetical protein
MMGYLQAVLPNNIFILQFQSKLGILNFLGADVFREEDILCHYIIAFSDTRHSITMTADLELKKIIGWVVSFL